MRLWELKQKVDKAFANSDGNAIVHIEAPGLFFDTDNYDSAEFGGGKEKGCYPITLSFAEDKRA